MKHPLQEMMDKRRQGIRCGIPSYCSANELVIEIALRRAKERNICSSAPVSFRLTLQPRV